VLVRVQAAAEVLARVQAAAVAAAKASVAVKVEKEEWVEEPWGLKASAAVPSAEHGLHTKEAFPVWSRNVPVAEQP
jgi:hypothetical protein